eukprot:snap_masked-scaffold_6-processed-gene-13.22-mRNA-1 protein AED:0.92 eAED:1.00 QI:0/-1/0/1/-1/1/1/0/1010
MEKKKSAADTIARYPMRKKYLETCSSDGNISGSTLSCISKNLRVTRKRKVLVLRVRKQKNEGRKDKENKSELFDKEKNAIRKWRHWENVWHDVEAGLEPLKCFQTRAHSLTREKVKICSRENLFSRDWKLYEKNSAFKERWYRLPVSEKYPEEFWRMSLRNANTRLVQVGNKFSGIQAEIKEQRTSPQRKIHQNSKVQDFYKTLNDSNFEKNILFQRGNEPELEDGENHLDDVCVIGEDLKQWAIEKAFFEKLSSPQKLNVRNRGNSHLRCLSHEMIKNEIRMCATYESLSSHKPCRGFTLRLSNNYRFPIIYHVESMSTGETCYIRTVSPRKRLVKCRESFSIIFSPRMELLKHCGSVCISSSKLRVKTESAIASRHVAVENQIIVNLKLVVVNNKRFTLAMKAKSYLAFPDKYCEFINFMRDHKHCQHRLYELIDKATFYSIEAKEEKRFLDSINVSIVHSALLQTTRLVEVNKHHYENITTLYFELSFFNLRGENEEQDFSSIKKSYFSFLESASLEYLEDRLHYIQKGQLHRDVKKIQNFSSWLSTRVFSSFKHEVFIRVQTLLQIIRYMTVEVFFPLLQQKVNKIIKETGKIEKQTKTSRENYDMFRDLIESTLDIFDSYDSKALGKTDKKNLEKNIPKKFFTGLVQVINKSCSKLREKRRLLCPVNVSKEILSQNSFRNKGKGKKKKQSEPIPSFAAVELNPDGNMTLLEFLHSQEDENQVNADFENIILISPLLGKKLQNIIFRYCLNFVKDLSDLFLSRKEDSFTEVDFLEDVNECLTFAIAMLKPSVDEEDKTKQKITILTPYEHTNIASLAEYIIKEKSGTDVVVANFANHFELMQEKKTRILVHSFETLLFLKNVFRYSIEIIVPIQMLQDSSTSLLAIESTSQTFEVKINLLSLQKNSKLTKSRLNKVIELEECGFISSIEVFGTSRSKISRRFFKQTLGSLEHVELFQKLLHRVDKVILTNQSMKLPWFMIFGGDGIVKDFIQEIVEQTQFSQNLFI